MFSRKIRVEYEQEGVLHPCPLRRLDTFSCAPMPVCSTILCLPEMGKWNPRTRSPGFLERGERGDGGLVPAKMIPAKGFGLESSINDVEKFNANYERRAILRLQTARAILFKGLKT